MKRARAQAVLPFSRKDRVHNRKLRQRLAGMKVQRGPGRPPNKNGRVPHQRRPALEKKSALHITLKVRSGVPNLRTRKRFNAFKHAFVKFCGADGSSAAVAGFRLIHFAVLSNHTHFIVEADSKEALSLGMRKLLHSLSRRLNALSVKDSGGVVSTAGGAYRKLRGWLGRVFSDRYHAHLLRSPTEMSRAVRYVLENASKHAAGRTGSAHERLSLDFFASALTTQFQGQPLTASPRGFLLVRACRDLLATRNASAG